MTSSGGRKDILGTGQVEKEPDVSREGQAIWQEDLGPDLPWVVGNRDLSVWFLPLEREGMKEVEASNRVKYRERKSMPLDISDNLKIWSQSLLILFQSDSGTSPHSPNPLTTERHCQLLNVGLKKSVASALLLRYSLLELRSLTPRGLCLYHRKTHVENQQSAFFRHHVGNRVPQPSRVLPLLLNREVMSCVCSFVGKQNSCGYFKIINFEVAGYIHRQLQ